MKDTLVERALLFICWDNQHMRMGAWCGQHFSMGQEPDDHETGPDEDTDEKETDSQHCVRTWI